MRIDIINSIFILSNPYQIDLSHKNQQRILFIKNIMDWFYIRIFELINQGWCISYRVNIGSESNHFKIHSIILNSLGRLSLLVSQRETLLR